MSYLGVPPFGQTVRTITELTATAGQTTFTPAGGYLPGYVDITLNGVALTSSDFTATNGATVVLAAAAAANDELRVTAYWPVSLVDTYRKGEVDAALALKQAADAELATLAGMTSDRATFLASANDFAFRNRIINGDMRIDQRNNGAAINNAPDGTWAVDRWVRYQNVGASNVGQNLNSIASVNGIPNQLGIQITTAGTATSTQYTNFQHYVEGFNAADLAWGTASAQPVTISFWVRSSITGTQGFALQNASSALGYPFTVTISAANTWEYKTVTIPGPTTGTWNTTNGRGITLVVDLGMGSSFRFAAGSWQAGNVQGVTGANSLNQTLNATFYITGVQLEAGSVATPFERRPYGTELALCQRYYSIGKSGFAARGGDNYYEGWVQLKEDMRATATITTSPGTWTIAGQRYDCFRAGKSGVSGGSEDFTYTASAEL